MITLRQIITMAKVATNPDKKFLAIGRKIVFTNKKAMVTDDAIAFQKSNPEIEGDDFALDADDIIKKIKVKDNKQPILLVGKGKINSTRIEEGTMEFPNVQMQILLKTKNEQSIEIPIDKKLLEKLLNCFEENKLILQFNGEMQPIIIRNKKGDEEGMIMQLGKI